MMEGGKDRDKIQSPTKRGIFVTVIKCPNMVEPRMSRITMQVVTRDSPIDLMMPFKLMSLLKRATRATVKAPTAPASVGVKNPFIIPPMTTMKITPTGATSLKEEILSLQ